MLFQEMLNDERAKGMAIGSILASLSFAGSVPEPLRQRILDEQDIETLNKWYALSQTATVEEFEQHMFD